MFLPLIKYSNILTFLISLQEPFGKNSNQIYHRASRDGGKKFSFKPSMSHDQYGRHAHIWQEL